MHGLRLQGASCKTWYINQKEGAVLLSHKDQGGRGGKSLACDLPKRFKSPGQGGLILEWARGGGV